MKIYLSCVLAAATLVSVCQAHYIGASQDVRGPRSRRELQKIEKINDMVDLMTREINPAMKKFNMDPFNAPNATQPSYIVTLYMNNIVVYNLSTIHRYGDIEVIDDEPGRKLTARIRLAFDDLQLISNYKTSAFLIASVGKVTAKIPGLLVDFTMTVNFKDLKITTTNFQLINNDSAMQVYFSGNIESILINIVNALVMRIVDDIILMIVQGPVQTQINNILDIINEMLQTTLNG